MAYKIIIITGFMLASFCIGCLALAKRDTLAAVTSCPSATVEFESFAPSTSYGVYLTFKVKNHAEIQRAHWRLIPFRYVDVEK